MLFSTTTAEYMDDKKKRLRATAPEGHRGADRASTGEVGLQVATTANRNVWNRGETSWFI